MVNRNRPGVINASDYSTILLNRANRVLGITRISTGGLVGTVIDVRVIYQYALKANATKLILAHSHPSGNLKPSEADISITRKIKERARQLDINLLDQTILTGDDRYYNFALEGDL